MTSAETIGEIIEGYETETSSLGEIFSFVTLSKERRSR